MVVKDLLPCPFCEGDCINAEISFSLREFRIYCDGDGDCLAEMRVSFEDVGIIGDSINFSTAFAAMNELTDLWNRRGDNA